MGTDSAFCLSSILSGRCGLGGGREISRFLWDFLGVVIAAEGYPDAPRSGDVIHGIDEAALLPGKLFHAGTRFSDGEVITSGGRVLCAVGVGNSASAAQAQAYELARAVRFKGAQYRHDIGYRAIAREE